MIIRIFLSVLMVLAVAVPSFAALTTEQQAVVTATQTMVTDLIAMGWGLVLSITGGLVGFKLFKRFFGKTT